MQGSTALDPTINWTERNHEGHATMAADLIAAQQAVMALEVVEHANPVTVLNLKWFVKLVSLLAMKQQCLTTNFVRTVIDKELLAKVVDNYKKKFNPPEHARANKMCTEQLWT